jgi:pseudaminic acid cytidylyltransferase
MHSIAIIPARGGSKRIPGKNIKDFAGRPIISYSIETARKSGLFDRIIVSTDSEEIASVARKFDSEVPFMRPDELSDDFTNTAEVLLHALSWLKKNGALPTYFCCIYATAPFIQAESLKEGLACLKQKDAVTAFSVTRFSYPILKALETDRSGYLKMVWPDQKNRRSNDLPETYHDAGQFYWAHTKRFLIEKTLFSSKAIPVVLPRHLVQDIDTPEDWEVAQHMYRAFKLRIRNSDSRQTFL